ncbi:MAG: tetratricopeptide repeat protein [Myxococcales bacterium]
MPYVNRASGSRAPSKRRGRSTALAAARAKLQLFHRSGPTPDTDAYWRWLQIAARLGDPDAQLEVGAHYLDGLLDSAGKVIAHRNSRAAVQWFRRAAEQGIAGAQLNLGYCIDTGTGTRRDPQAARRWYMRAYRQGDAAAASNIATMYRDANDDARSFAWYERAAAMGDGDALLEVGKHLLDGRGVRTDERRAMKCFRRAARSRAITEAGREEATALLARRPAASRAPQPRPVDARRRRTR